MKLIDILQSQDDENLWFTIKYKNEVVFEGRNWSRLAWQLNKEVNSILYKNGCVIFELEEDK